MDDKKKIAILASLFIVMISVGAFQFVKSGTPEPAAAAPTETKASAPVKGDTAKADVQTPEGGLATNATTAPLGAAKTEPGAVAEVTPGEVDPALVLAAKLNPRDPFDGRRWDKSQTNESTPQPTPPQPKVTYAPPRPRSMGGNLKPLDPGLVGVLPEAGGKAPEAMPSINDFQWSVSGTVDGSRPCAVFTDSAGKQKLVTVGGSIDGDSQLLSISKGKVTIRHRGAVKTFTTGGVTPSEKKQEGNQ